jgi:negative regulator of sigma E activity
MVAIKRLATVDADFKAKMDALLAFEAAPMRVSNAPSPASWLTSKRAAMRPWSSTPTSSTA